MYFARLLIMRCDPVNVRVLIHNSFVHGKEEFFFCALWNFRFRDFQPKISMQVAPPAHSLTQRERRFPGQPVHESLMIFWPTSPRVTDDLQFVAFCGSQTGNPVKAPGTLNAKP